MGRICHTVFFNRRGWDEVQVGSESKENKRKWRPRQGLTGVWEPVSCVLTVRLCSLFHRPSLHTIPLKKARIKTVGDKYKRDTSTLIPLVHPPPATQWYRTMEWCVLLVVAGCVILHCCAELPNIVCRPLLLWPSNTNTLQIFHSGWVLSFRPGSLEFPGSQGQEPGRPQDWLACWTAAVGEEVNDLCSLSISASLPCLGKFLNTL